MSYLKANDIEELSLLDEIYQSIIEYRLTHQGIVNRYIRKQDPDVKYGTGGFPFDSFLQELIDMVEVSPVYDSLMCQTVFNNRLIDFIQ